MNMFEEKIHALTHLGENPKKHLGAIVPPLFQNTLFVHFNEDEPGGEGYGYTRASNPTIALLEEKYAALEGSQAALAMSSGMAAISSAIMHCVSSGKHIVCIRSCYGGTYGFLSEYLARFGVEVTFVDGDTASYIAATRDNTALYYLESPSTAIFKIQDLSAITEYAKSRGIRTIIDNTWATPMFQNPIKLGVDIVVHSASKYFGGHSDVVAGAIMGSEDDIKNIRRNERMNLGGSMDPFAAWLVLRGLRTLHLRMQRSMENGLKIAEFLQQHPKVKQVLYPGLASHPGHDIALRQMTGFSSLMGIRLSSDEGIRKKFIKSLKLFANGCSWGGFESLVINFGSCDSAEHDWPDDLIRLYIGLENADDLIGDLAQALNLL